MKNDTHEYITELGPQIGFLLLMDYYCYSCYYCRILVEGANIICC